MRLSYHSGFATLYKKSLVCFFLVLLPSWLMLLWLKLSIKSLNHKYFFLFERCEARCGTACVCVSVCAAPRQKLSEKFLAVKSESCSCSQCRWKKRGRKVAAAAQAAAGGGVRGAPPDESAYKRQFKVDYGAAPPLLSSFVRVLCLRFSSDNC